MKYTYTFDQLRDNDKGIEALFMNYQWAQTHGGIDQENYFTADSGTVEATSPEAACEKLYRMYNVRAERPAGYEGRSMSVSDIVCLWDNNVEPPVKTAWYCDSIGFKRLPPVGAPVYGYVNGRPTYSRNEFIYAKRGFEEIEADADLLAYAKQVTHNWYHAGWHQSFEGFYLSDYALSEPCSSLTASEFARLKKMQAEAKEEAKRIEAEKEWRHVDTIYWADNSEEEIWENKYGERKKIMTVGPHGDAC